MLHIVASFKTEKGPAGISFGDTCLQFHREEVVMYCNGGYI